uniref:BHLH domain-containing protein n=1 Tax=Meloidogyne enterolobii TaxID=390850 RepID=A0A6V7TTH4_MELEN|nr:unnamed protein product [Meloidogyne enterolobii]
MLNSFTPQQHQQAVSQHLSIEQLLRAAKLIEQRAIIEKMPSQFSEIGGFSANFGEKYEARILAPKLRTFVGDPNCGPSSTGSSQRSSPLSASPSPDLAVLACLHSPQYYQQQTQQNLTLLESQQRQSISTSSAASSIASGSSMATTTDARRLSTRLDDNLSPSASHGVGSGRRASGSRQSRAAHNELEKNRRANLRGHLEALKSVLPPESDTHRDTTLSLLTRARNYIKFVDEQKSALLKKREALLAEHSRLQQLLQQNKGEGVELPQYNDKSFKEATASLTPSQNETCRKILKIVQIPEEREEEVEGGEEINVDFTQYEISQNCLIKEKKVEEDEKNNSKQETNNIKVNMEEYLSLNGLLPALPLLYPYSSVNSAGVAGTMTA